MTSEHTDDRLTALAQAIGGSRKSLAQTYADLNRVQFVVGRAERNASRYDQDVIGAARTLLQNAIQTLISVHDNLQRAELNGGER